MGNVAVFQNYLVVGALLFTLGLVGFLTRRNVIIMFLCAEVMLQGVTVTLIGASVYHGTWSGQILTIFSLAIAAAEAALALALVVMLFRRAGSLDISIWQDLREPNQPAVEDDDTTANDATVEPSWPHLTTAGRLPKQSIGASASNPALRQPAETTSGSANGGAL
jgi:NADH-quinone oxidoreductase subunit K